MVSLGIWTQQGNKIVCGKGYAIATINSHATSEGKANGALIVNSAKMLDVLKSLRASIVLGGGMDEAFDAATKLIREIEMHD